MQSAAHTLGLPQPPASQVGQQYYSPFFQHLTWFLGDDEQQVVDIYVEFYHRWVSTVGHMYPEVMGTLESLKYSGYMIAVFSDKRKQFAELEVEQSCLGHLLDYTLFLVDGRPYKPDPFGLLHVLKALGTPKSQAVYVGDGSHDLECARRTGGAALWGPLNREDLLDGHPDHSWEAPDRILLSLD